MYRHLSSCRECQAVLDSLRVAADALPASVPEVEPPPELKARVMSIVRAEAELLQAAGATADRPVRERRLWPWPSLTVGSWRPAVAALSAAVVVAVVIALASGGGPSARTVEAQMSVPGHAFITLRGRHAELAVRGIPAPPANHVDELWVRHGSTAPQPAGTFVLGSGTVAVQRPVRSGMRCWSRSSQVAEPRLRPAIRS